MKILEVVTALESGGAERFVVDMCNQMAQDGHDVVLLCIQDPNVGERGFYLKDVSPEVKFVTLGAKSLGVGTFFAMLKAVKRIGADVVHINSMPATAMVFIAMLLYRKSKYVVTCHNQAQFERSYGWKFQLKKLAYSLRLFEHVAISHENEKSIYDVYGIKASKLIYNGRAAMRTTDKIDDVRREVEGFKATEHTLIFTIVARCMEQKNIPRLVRCFNEVKRRGADIALIVIGERYDGEIGQKAMADAMPHIHFLGVRHNVADYLSMTDFFTLSSDFEGMPVSLIEAMAFGCIPVATPVSGVKDVIENGVTGFIAENFSDEGYISAIERAIEHRADVDRNLLMSKYIDNFTMKNCSRKYEQFFADLIK